MHYGWVWSLACLMIVLMLLQDAEGKERRRGRSRRLRHKGARARLRRYLLGQNEWARAWSPVRLTSQTHYNLAILENGTVTSTSEDIPEGQIQRISLDAGLVLLKGVVSNTYLAINSGGHLISTPVANQENVFIESMTSNFYTTFKSHRFRRRHWYIGIKRNSRLHRNRKGQERKVRRSTLFTVRRTGDSS